MSLCRVILVLLVIVWALDVWADLPATGGVGRGVPGGGHGWVAIPEPTKTNPDASVLAHVPPRRGVGGAGAADGVVLPAVRLESMPVTLAACGDEVFLFFRASGNASGSRYSVLSLRAIKSPVADLYAYEPQGRLRAHPSVPVRGHLVGAVGTARGPVALVRERDAAGKPVVVRLVGDTWETLPDLEGRFGAGADLRLISIAGEPWVVGEERDGGTIALAWQPARGMDGDAKANGGAWVERRIPAWGRTDRGTLVGVGAVLARVDRAGGELVASTVVGDEWVDVARRTDSGAAYGATWLEEPARLAVVWMEGGAEEEDAKGKPPAQPMVWEISLGTGGVLHDGRVLRSGPLSTQDFRALVVLLVGATAAVLLFVIRVGDDDGVLRLPEGVALASGGRRAMAGFIDVMLAAVVVGTLTGAPVAAVLDVLKLTPHGLGVIGLVDLIGVGFVMGTVGEAIFGRSIGKALTGCIVLPVIAKEARGGRGTGLWRAAVRNAVKWGLPPAVMLGLFEGGGRHRGDLVARTVVVERADGG